MLSLKNQVRWCIRAQVSMGGLLVVIAASFYFLGYGPLIQRQKSLNADIQRMQQELVDNSNRSQILPQVAVEVKNLRLRVDGAKKMPKDSDISGFINDVERISQRTSLRKPDSTPDAPKPGELFSIFPYRLQLRGNFANVFAFIRETESLPRLSRVRSINIKADDQPGSVIVNLGIDLYYSPDM
jgi:Tfp pilus assembly protein PilO